MHLEHVLSDVYYLPGPSNVGLVMGNKRQAFLIDSGVGQRAGRQILELLEQHGLTLAAILNTHGHGDHVGGNAYLVAHTGARVYAPIHDAVVLQYPMWGTLCTFGGAEPVDELSGPRFAPQPCVVDQVVTEGEVEVAGVKVTVVPLPGHTGSHTGYIVDDVFFTGDLLAGDEELANAPVSYAYSITARLASLEKLRGFSCACYIPGHGAVQRSVTTLIDRNIAQVQETLGFIRSHLAQDGMDAAELLVAVCNHYGIEIRNIKQYYLLYPALHAYLSHLANRGEITHEVRGNRLLWHIADRSVSQMPGA